MRTKHLMVGGLVVLVAALAMAAAGSAFRSNAGSPPLRADFTYRGEPIHPKLVEEFESWLSDDRPPSTVMVDVVAAFGSNEYSETVEASERGLIRYASGAAWYGYEHLGQMADGTHVLRTASSGGGSGIFHNLLFIRLREDEARTPTGDRYGRVLMEVVGHFVLGDRDDGAVEVQGDHVVVGASRYRAFPTTLDFGR